MSHILAVDPFTAAKLADVQDFDCGGKPFETEVSDWIKGPEGVEDTALGNLKQGNCRVWLYRLPNGQIVGFSSLGKSNWRFPDTGKREDISIIPHLGVKLVFQGQPKGVPREERYAYQIMSHLI